MPLDGEALGALAVQSGRAWTRGGTQGSSDLCALARLAYFGRCGAAVVGGMNIDAQLREEAAHGDVAIEYAACKGEVGEEGC